MPIRTCISCRTKKEKKELLRIVSVEGKALIDKEQNKNTRGIYICNNTDCINKLLKGKDISKCIKIKLDASNVKDLLKNLGE